MWNISEFCIFIKLWVAFQLWYQNFSSKNQKKKQFQHKNPSAWQKINERMISSLQTVKKLFISWDYSPDVVQHFLDYWNWWIMQLPIAGSALSVKKRLWYLSGTWTKKISFINFFIDDESKIDYNELLRWRKRKGKSSHLSLVMFTCGRN